MTPETLTVSLGDRSYDIHFGKDLSGSFQAWLAANAPGADVFVVTDRNVAAIYGADFARWVGDAPHAVLSIEPGEERKTWDTVRDIYAFLARGAGPGSTRGADRDSIVVAFGGGVVGDLAGFAAATWLRGVRYVQVPTTLLAQVDSSVGGKTGFNLPQGKNLAGAFHQPRAVFIDRSFLLTLDDRNLRAGMAEVVKCALAGDAMLWTLLLEHGARWKAMTDRDWAAVVRRSVAFKASVVEKDEREASTRRILNLGHTVGHALERAAGYGRFLHGEAVAIGLAWEAVFASRLGATPPDLADRICGVLGEMGFVLDDASVSTLAIVAALSSDKKRVDADIDMPMVSAPGSCVLRRVPSARLARDLAEVRDDVRERSRMPGLQPAASMPPDRGDGAGRAAAVPAEERALLERIAQGGGEAIVAALERKVASDPRDVPSIILLATAYRRVGNAAGAWEMIKEALAQRPSDARAQRLAREIEKEVRSAPRTGGDAAAAPLEDVLILDDEKFELSAADVAGAAPPGEQAPGAPGPQAGGGAAAEESAPAATLVRTITMADVCWAQGRRDEAREIVAEILRNDPGDARALAWRAAREGKAGDEGADAAARTLSTFLETIAKEYGHDFSRPL